MQKVLKSYQKFRIHVDVYKIHFFFSSKQYKIKMCLDIHVLQNDNNIYATAIASAERSYFLDNHQPSKEQAQAPSFFKSSPAYVLTNLQFFLTSPPAGLVMLPIFTMESENCLKNAAGSAQYLFTVSAVE